MKILITGLAGFVGKETEKLLKENGHKVAGIDIMHGGDIRDKTFLREGIKDSGIDRILHLAAISRFADADKDPKLAFETNVLGTKNVVEVAKEFHVPVVYSSTGSVYMPIENLETSIKEDWSAKGNSVYGCTKYMGELYVKTHTPHIILRYAHLYGALKFRHGLIGGYISRIERGMAPVLYGGAQSNDFTYIKDIARANLSALTAPWDAWNETYNIGTGEELTAEDAGKIVCDTFEYDGEVEKKEARTVDPQRFFFDVAKAKERLGFEAEYNFASGLKDMKEEIDATKT